MKLERDSKMHGPWHNINGRRQPPTRIINYYFAPSRMPRDGALQLKFYSWGEIKTSRARWIIGELCRLGMKHGWNLHIPVYAWHETFYCSPQIRDGNLAVYFPLDFSGEETLVHLSNYTAKPHGRLAACMLSPISFRVLQMCASRDAGMWRKKWTRRLFCIIKRKLCMLPLCTQFVLLDYTITMWHIRAKK